MFFNVDWWKSFWGRQRILFLSHKIRGGVRQLTEVDPDIVTIKVRLSWAHNSPAVRLVAEKKLEASGTPAQKPEEPCVGNRRWPLDDSRSKVALRGTSRFRWSGNTTGSKLAKVKRPAGRPHPLSLTFNLRGGSKRTMCGYIDRTLVKHPSVPSTSRNFERSHQTKGLPKPHSYLSYSSTDTAGFQARRYSRWYGQSSNPGRIE